MFTDNQLNILATLISQPETEYTMSELGEALGKRPGVFQKGINALERRGYITSRKRGNQRLFKISADHPLFNEIKGIVQKTSGVEGLLRTLVGKIPEIRTALIYGSYPNDKMRPDSDIDLLIVSDTSHTEEILLRKLPALERKIQREISYKFYLAKEFRKKCRSRDAFLEEVLNNKHILLKGTL